ncbi:MAG TPA: hypothetical protein VKB76_04755, partial [Ktedonobacterales bacterium]|nr:hypothetical protein [Ktedonobacterales bacterium]
MSLTAHINNTGSLIGQYLWQRYHSSAPLARAANRQLIGATTIRPDVTGYPWAMVSRAVDYRLRYAFGLTRRQLAVPAYGAQILAEQHAEHYQSSLWQAFFDQLDTTIANLQPAGRRLDREGEGTLARYCYVLALLDEAARTNRYVEGPLFAPAPKSSIDALLAIPDDIVIADMCRMGTLFGERYNFLAARPHVVNPRLAGPLGVGDARIDLIVDGCLLLVKTTVQPRIEARWLRHLAGAVLLDYDDIYHMRSVGIYMARQGMLLRWPIADFLATLSRSPQP